MSAETLSWDGLATVTLHGVEYACSLDCEVELTNYEQSHGPGRGEPTQDTLIELGQFEAELGGKPVHDMKLRREIRAELVEWANENQNRIIQEAK